MKRLMIKTCLFTAAIATSCVYAADVQVVDLSQGGQTPQSVQTLNQALSTPVEQSLSLDQRVARLESQVQNIVQMNLPAKINDLQQQVQQLTGQLEVQSHNLKLLNEQQRNFYQDLDQRLNNLKAIVTAGGTATTPATINSEKPANGQAKNQGSTSDVFSAEQKAYQNAFELLSEKKYDQAVSAFQNYIDNYPNGKHAVNAHYWLGEVYSLQNKNQQAVNEFQTVISKYPDSPKISDAKYKLALIHIQMGKQAQAKQELQQIVQKYPNTAAARLAKMQLQQMQ